MTPQETAEKIRDMLLALGCPAACGASGHPMTKGSWWVTAGEGSLEEPVFDCGADGVAFRSVRSSVGALRVRKATTDWAAIGNRCDAAADLNLARVAHKAAVQEAWAVVDELKKLGMAATMQEGRVRITLDFSPEYAREMGPKLLAVLGERKAGA